MGAEDDKYDSEIAVDTAGLVQWFTRFRGYARSEGGFSPDGLAVPSRYEARYDLRKRRDRHISLVFVHRSSAVIAERSATDTSSKPPIAEIYRRNIVDPLSALVSIRRELAQHPPHLGDHFTIPVYDGARRFDVAAEISSIGGRDDLIGVHLMLLPIAGFKSGGGDHGDIEAAPRPMDLTLTHDGQLVPVSVRVIIAWFPVVIRLIHTCANFSTCAQGRG